MSTPLVIARLKEALAQHEGLVLKAYDDANGKVVDPGTLVKGYVTIGMGRNLVGKGITLQESNYLLANDIADVTSGLDKVATGWWRRMEEPRQLALMELCYNMGPERFFRLFPNTVSDIRDGNYAQAGQRLRVSKWRKQVGDSRAMKIIRLLETGAWN